ncbi:hypothetical protein BV378_20645 [Nostoc sp. RF31YmG]|jgi:hypothetical protein|nr:hypothetical protein BV378_20645 [Nostoc sp. RF31YmG]
MTHTAAITRKNTRRKNDAYFTPTSAVDTLLNHIDITGTLLEPCNGSGAISNRLKEDGLSVITTDIADNPQDDATTHQYWQRQKPYDWVVTNPPFDSASKILPKAYEYASVGVAFLLRLSYLEPCKDRGQWLAEHPPKLIVLPRISFTGDGKVDSCTCAWMIWKKGYSSEDLIIVPKK